MDGSYVYTIEGNTSGANGVIANGGGVCKKKYRLTYNRIAGYGRPDWGTEVETQPVTPMQPKPTIPNGKVITITANSVNMRVGDSTKYASLGHLKKGEVLEWVADAPNGWHAGRHRKQIVWVSNKYSAVSGG